MTPWLSTIVHGHTLELGGYCSGIFQYLMWQWEKSQADLIPLPLLSDVIFVHITVFIVEV